MALGVEPITGKPCKPTTQGKNERFHQTLFRYLDKQPLATDLAQLQTHVDAFDHLYNTQRPHQGLPGRVTHLTAWEATAKTEAPRPNREQIARSRIHHPRTHQPRPAPTPAELSPDTVVKKLTSAGVLYLNKVQYLVGAQHRFQQISAITNGDKITVTSLDGEILIEHTRRAPGIAYVGNAKPPGPNTDKPQTSPKS